MTQIDKYFDKEKSIVSKKTNKGLQKDSKVAFSAEKNVNSIAAMSSSDIIPNFKNKQDSFQEKIESRFSCDGATSKWNV